MGAFEFQKFDPADKKLNYQSRNGETRVGDILSVQNLASARFVLIGISENVGPQANLGKPGSEHAFHAFTKVFFNTQVHHHLAIHQIAYLGVIKQVKDPSNRPEACEFVQELDAFVFDVLKAYLLPTQIPIIIGGGHNNALPLIRWAAQKEQISVLNIDAHADLRTTDKRHSGNSFSFALQEGLVKQYGVFGLHEAFNNEFIRDFLNRENISFRFFEDYLKGSNEFYKDVLAFVEHRNAPIGLEIDMDAIAYMPSSAMSPSGWALDDIRSFILKLDPSKGQIAYLNLTEAAPINEREELMVGKALSYLVRDFCRTV